MGPRHYEEFEKKLRVRPLRMDDFDQLVAMQEVCFPGMKPWLREQLESQLDLFPEGQICVEIDGRIVASASSLILEFEEYSEWHNFAAVSDNGTIRNHDAEGDTLYGIEMMVHPEFRGYRLSRRLYNERKALAREKNLKRIIIGGRIPGYGRYADEMSAREYVEEVMHKGIYDPVLTAQIANGFVLRQLIPDYMPSDEASRGFATYLEWVNLDYVPESGPERRYLRTAPVRLAVVQYQLREIDDFDDFVKQCEFFVDVAGDYRADFVVFPELVTTQLLSYLPNERPGLAARRLAEETPAYLELFTRLALKYNVNIVGGTQFELVEGSLLNVGYLFRRDGTIGRQPKLHVTPSEKKWWGVEPGPAFEVFDTDAGRVAILISYDCEHPELARLAAAKGAEILFVPFNVDEESAYFRIRICARARAIENDVYVAISGCVGNLPFVNNADVHFAQSGIYTPSAVSFDRDGIAKEATPNIETVIIHDVDLEQLRRHRRRGQVRNREDRRRDLYSIRFRGPDGVEEEI